MSTENSVSVKRLKKPQFIAKRYHKEHPHFVRHVILDAIIIGMFVGFASYAFSNTVGLLHRQPAALEIIGRKSISLEAMKETVRKNNLIVYWLGGNKDSVFSLDYTTRTEPILANMTPKTVGELWGVKIVSIQTYLSNAKFKERLLGRIHAYSDTISIDSRGDKFMTNPDHPSEMVVDIAQTDRVVVVDYLLPQTIASLKADAEKLTLVE